MANVTGLAKSYSETVFAQLREDILSGRRRPGDRLVELEIAQGLGISQGPVREALARLREQHLIMSVPHRGSFVAEASASEARDVAEVRRVLEPLAVERALPGIDERRLTELQRAVDAAVKAARKRDFATMFLHDMTFHRLLFTWAESPTLLGFWHHIEATARKFATVVAPQVFMDPEEVAGTHLILIDLLREGDMDELRPAIDAHIMRLWNDVDGDPEVAE